MANTIIKISNPTIDDLATLCTIGQLLLDDVSVIAGIDTIALRGQLRNDVGINDLADEADDEADVTDVNEVPYTGPVCSVCGCTNVDCSQCIEVLGEPCGWATDDPCTRCFDALPEAVPVEDDGACPDDPDGVHHVGCGCDDTTEETTNEPAPDVDTPEPASTTDAPDPERRTSGLTDAELIELATEVDWALPSTNQIAKLAGIPRGSVGVVKRRMLELGVVPRTVTRS